MSSAPLPRAAQCGLIAPAQLPQLHVGVRRDAFEAEAVIVAVVPWGCVVVAGRLEGAINRLVLATDLAVIRHLRWVEHLAV